MKKILLMVMAMALVAAISVGATLAYLTDRDNETNVFTMGNVSIALNEDFQQGVEMLPGVDIKKEVTITNTGSNDAWVWYTYAVPTALVDQGNNASKNAIHFNLKASTWYPYSEQSKYWEDGQTEALPYGQTWTWSGIEHNVDINGMKYTIVTVLYNGTLAPGKTTPVSLENIYMDTRVDATPEGDLYWVENGVTTDLNWNVNTNGAPVIYVNAYGIQADNFDTVEEAYDAYVGQWGTNNNGAYPVVVNTVDELADALEKGGSYALGSDIELDADNTMTVPSGVTTNLNLNGFTVDGTSDVSTGNRDMITVKGTLNITNGTITMEHIGDNMGWNASTNIINITAGGKVSLDNAVLRNLGGSDMAFAVHMNNWGEVTLNANDSTIFSTYCAVRVFNAGPNMNNVTITNSELIATRALWVHMYTAADFGANYDAEAVDARLNINVLIDNPVTGLAADDASNLNANANNTVVGSVSYGFTDRVVYYTTSGSAAVAGTAEELTEALENGSHVLMTEDVEAELTQDSNLVYGNQMGAYLNGGTLDGNGNELSVGSDSGYTLVTAGGTVKNLTVVDGQRGIVLYYPAEDTIIDNVVIDGPGYAINTTEGDGTTALIVTNSTINGWTSFGNLSYASFTNCSFGMNTTKFWQLNYGYDADYDRLIRPYVDTILTNCQFEKDYYLSLDVLGTDGDGRVLDADATVTLTDCYCGDVLLTAENYADYITVEQGSCGHLVINGVTVY